MSIFVIADLHLSLRVPKPMDIFGDNWSGHEEKIKKDWLEKVKENDLVILPGDFSWETYLENTKLDFGYLNSLPGKKLMLKGNHDYWWTTLTNMRKFLQEFITIIIQILIFCIIIVMNLKIKSYVAQEVGVLQMKKLMKN